MISRLVVAAILIVLVLWALFWAPLPLLLIVVDFFLILAVWELLRLLGASGGRTWWPLMVLASFPWVWVYQPQLRWIAYLVAFLALLSESLLAGRNPSQTVRLASARLLALTYVTIPLALAATYRSDLPEGGSSGDPWELLFLLVAIWTSDSSAFFVGRRLGRHRVTPSLSPGKSLEGFLAGAVAPPLMALWLGPLLLPHFSLPWLTGAALVVAVSAIAGDLFESALKRSAKAKDSSSVLPGHGGVLDRIDSLLFALPSYYVYSNLLK